jgi:signal transduction histidine kinase
MLERARALGGGLEVTSSEGGTTVSATIPHVSGS